VLGAANPTHIDAIEQHGQLRGVHLDRAPVVSEAWSTKTASLEPFVIENEAAAIPKQDLAAVSSTPQKHEQVPGEQVHAPLPADNAAQTVVATTKIDWLDREIDPNTRWQREQRLPQPANHGCHVRGIAAFLETKPKTGTELELDLLRHGAGQPHRQQRQSLGLQRGRAGRLVQVVLQGGVGYAMLSGDINAGDGTFSRLRHDRCPKFSSTRW
jgi:hypothetical protein